MQADEERVFAVDQIALAVIQRSTTLIDGFSVMIQRGNLLCVGALLRLQLDSVLRFFATSLVDDPSLILRSLLEDRPLSKIKTPTGKRLTDTYLSSQLSKLSKSYSWVANVYTKTSGFIHLSQSHFIATVSGINRQQNEIEFTIGKNALQFSESQLCEAIEAFIATTNALFSLLVSWLDQKEVFAHERKGATPDTP